MHFGACSWKVAGWLLPKPFTGQRRETGTHMQVNLRLGALKEEGRAELQSLGSYSKGGRLWKKERKR